MAQCMRRDVKKILDDEHWRGGHCAINPLCFQKWGVFGGSAENAIQKMYLPPPKIPRILCNPARNSNRISEFLAGAVVFISEFLAGAQYLMDVILSNPAKKSHFCFHGTVCSLSCFVSAVCCDRSCLISALWWSLCFIVSAVCCSSSCLISAVCCLLSFFISAVWCLLSFLFSAVCCLLSF